MQYLPQQQPWKLAVTGVKNRVIARYSSITMQKHSATSSMAIHTLTITALLRI